MNSTLLRSFLVLVCAAACLLVSAPSIHAAAVGSSGYTNDFTSAPIAADWATLSVGGSGTDSYDLDAAIQTTGIPGGTLASGSGNPATQNQVATWSSSGFIQTRPTGNRYTVLMGKFINSTGTNATQIRISYLMNIAGGGSPEDSGKGTRFYFSTSGAANSWTNIPAFNTESTGGAAAYSASLAVNWPDGGNFYLLTADDNGGSGTDSACEIDNFFLGVTAGTPATPVDPLIIALTGPTNNATYDYTIPITASATVTGGTTPYSLRFFVDGAPVGVAQSTPPFQANLGTLSPGDHTIRASVTDSRAWTSNSADALVHITGPLFARVISPTNGARLKAGAPISIGAAVGGGTGPYTVTVYTNGQALPNLTSPPFVVNLGALGGGSYTTYVHVADSALPSAAQTNSATNVFLVEYDPLANDYFTNRFPIQTGQTVAANNTGATTEPGERTTSRGTTLWWKWVAPVTGIAVADTFGSSFDTYLGIFTGSAMGSLALVGENDDYQSAQSRVQFACQAGVEYQIQAGGYFSSQGSLMVHIDVPPIVTITSPVNGASFVAGSNITVTATASSPYGAVTNVDFYEFDFNVGAPAFFARDAAAPYSAIFTNSTQGDHYVQAVMSDATGRNSTSDWVYINFALPGVHITNPGEGQVFLGSDSIFVSVVATLLEPVTNVAFYVDGTRFAQSTTPPYQAILNAATTGNHVLTAIAMTSTGTNYVSEAIHIRVGQNMVAADAAWKYLDNGSNQGTNWYGTNYNDSAWASGPAPLGYGDSNGRQPATTVGFGPSSSSKYPTTYFRRTLNITNITQFEYMYFELQRDDGIVVYFNGQEFFRENMNAGPPAYTDFSAANANDDGVSTFSQTLFPPFAPYLHEGTNVVAVEIHQDAANSSDIWFAFNMVGIPSTDPSTIPPTLATILPNPSDPLFSLTSITLVFSEAVTNVDASDLLINGLPATGVSGSSNTWTFSFPQPPIGIVSVSVSDTNGIVDFDSPPRPWSSGLFVTYTLLDADAPTIVSQTPPAFTTVSNLSQISVTFNKAVTGVNPADLLLNSTPALSVSGGPITYNFGVPVMPEGTVFISWASDHGIVDSATGSHLFDPNRPQHGWYYTLQDQAPPIIIGRSPAAGASVTNLTSLSVMFSEPIAGIGASDLLINGAPASGITTNNSTNYTFTFQRPNGTVVNVTWATTHGITDFASIPNAFNSSAPGASWSYSTPDTVAPAVASIDPPAFVTVRTLTQIRVAFTEPVTGVDTNDLLINGKPVTSVNGSGAGPYIFGFPAPTNGAVTVAWRPGHGITDLAASPNAFGGGAWTYVLDPNASYAGSVVINEIMYDPISGRSSDEWIELLNLTAASINLAGWKFTKGVSFTFPNVNLPANGYLVVAANSAAFASNYPGVANIGGWTGSLRNNGESVQLETALGDAVAGVSYSSEGDWGQRVRGNGASAVTSLTRSGSTVTATVFNHGYTASDQVVIMGADQPEYNGRFTVVSVPNRSSFTYTIAGTPATPATGSIISHQVRDDNVSGWAWFSPANGLGSSVELLNSSFDNSSGQNWSPSLTIGGTPGAANTGVTNNIPPLVLNVKHFPPVPKSTDNVSITARIRDELGNGVSSAQLFYRVHNTTAPGPFLSATMLDDGTHGDGSAGDGTYGAILPPMANRTIIEFYVSASDTSGKIRTWPAAAWETNGVGGTFGTRLQAANAIYQVDDEAPSSVMPMIRFILTGTEAASFPPGNRNSDGAYNGTLIAIQAGETDIRYLCDARVRGAGTRSRTPPNNRINIPQDNTWNGRSAINLGSQFIHAQLIGNVLAEEAGLFSEMPYVVQYRINGVNPAPFTAPVNGSGAGAGWGTFILARPMDGDLAAEAFPDDDAGNTYRASTGNHSADLSYQGTSPTTYVGRGYFKTSNRSENDWSDLFALTAAFTFNGANSDYIQGISTNVNVSQWMTYFALSCFLNDGETKLANGIGDDYGFYRGISDPRFVMEAHDFDTVFGEGDTGSGYYPINTNSSIFLMLNPPNGNANVPLLRRFMTNNAFVPLYYGALKRLADTVFNPTNLAPLIDQKLGTWGIGPDETVLQRMKDYAECRRQIILSQIPLDLTVTSGLTSANGYLFTSTPNVSLSGRANAITTRSVLVNGQAAAWSGFNAQWNSTSTLQPGINKVLVQAFDANNAETARATIEIWYSNGAPASVSGTIAADTTWSGSAGPYLVAGNLTVNAGATLTIQPGTTVYLAPGINITVNTGGRIVADGTDASHIRFTRPPGTSGNWGNIRINGAAGSPESRISYADIEFNAIGTSTPAIQVTSGTVFFDHLTFANTASPYIHVDAASFVIQNSVFPTPSASFEMVHGTGGVKTGGARHIHA